MSINRIAHGFAAVAALCALAPAEAGEFASALVGRWTTGAGLFKKLPPNWAGRFSSMLYSQAPVIAYFSDSNENRGVVACSEALRRVNFEMGIVEETAQSSYKVSLFSESEPPLSSSEVSIRATVTGEPLNAAREARAVRYLAYGIPYCSCPHEQRGGGLPRRVIGLRRAVRYNH